MRFGIIGSGSWATALAKILTDNGVPINWWVRNEGTVRHLQTRHHNPNYISSVQFDISLITPSTDVSHVIETSDCLVVAVPSAFVTDTFRDLPGNILRGRKVVSAVKGILPENNQLLHAYFADHFGLALEDYFTVMGPCHAEEVAAEKLSYLTFSGIDPVMTGQIAAHFKTPYLNTVTNQDIIGVQYAAVLKNIYALGAGIAHGLEYGDNFLSVFIANCADEMAGFLKKLGHAPGALPSRAGASPPNYAASVYLGDLLVTCYSLFSRNRTFGNMIGKGYSVKAAKLELSMVAEGYNASKCIYMINSEVQAKMPIAGTIYSILWEHVKARSGFELIEQLLV